MTRPLLAALVLALAAVLAPVAGASSAVADVGGGEGGDQGWVPTAPGWLDPGPRGPAVTRPALTRLGRRQTDGG